MIHWRKNMAGGGSRSHASAARKAAGLFGAELSDEQAKIVGEALHLGVGASMGSLYGAVRPHIPAPPIRGLAFGAVAWLIDDEIGNVAAGITPGSQAFPWQTHARGLAAHLTFGLLTQGILSAVDWMRWRGHPVVLPPVREPLRVA